ncbi:hypothetical protein ACJX0J_035663, partial [Zea mays]
FFGVGHMRGFFKPRPFTSMCYAYVVYKKVQKMKDEKTTSTISTEKIFELKFIMDGRLSYFMYYKK